MKRFLSQRLLSLLLAVAVLFGCQRALFPLIASAEGSGTVYPISCWVRAEGDDGTEVPRTKVTFTEYRSFSTYGLKNAPNDPGYITPMHFLLQAMEDRGMTEELAQTDIGGGGWISDIFGWGADNLWFKDGIDAPTMSPVYQAEEGDDYIFIQASYGMDGYTAFGFFGEFGEGGGYSEVGADETPELTAEAGIPLTLKYLYTGSMHYPQYGPCTGAMVYVSQEGKDNVTDEDYREDIVVGEDGAFDVTFQEAGTYVISARYFASDGTRSASNAYCKVTVLPATSPEEDQEIINSDKDALKIPELSNPTNVTADQLTLSSKGESGRTQVSWKSSNTAVVTDDGKITRPNVGEPNAEVTMTASLIRKGITETKAFTFCVKAYSNEEVQDDLTAVIEKIALSGKTLIPQSSTNAFTHQENILDVVSKLLKDAGRSDITAAVKSSSNPSYVAADGTISYCQPDDPNYPAEAGLTLTLSVHGSEKDVACTSLIGWDAKVIVPILKAEADKFTFDAIKGENTDAGMVVKSLVLPQYIGESYDACKYELKWQVTSGSSYLKINADTSDDHSPLTTTTVRSSYNRTAYLSVVFRLKNMDPRLNEEIAASSSSMRLTLPKKNAELSALSVTETEDDLAFSSSKTSYTLLVKQDNIEVTAAAVIPTATINGQAISGQAQPYMLEDGVKEITLEVNDEGTTKTYRLTLYNKIYWMNLIDSLPTEEDSRWTITGAINTYDKIMAVLDRLNDSQKAQITNSGKLAVYKALYDSTALGQYLNKIYSASGTGVFKDAQTGSNVSLKAVVSEKINLKLPKDTDDYTAVWSSSDDSIISVEGAAATLVAERPAFGEEDKTVTLTVAVTPKGETSPVATREYTLTIPAYSLGVTIRNGDHPLVLHADQDEYVMFWEKANVTIVPVKDSPTAVVTVDGAENAATGSAGVNKASLTVERPYLKTVIGVSENGQTREYTVYILYALYFDEALTSLPDSESPDADVFAAEETAKGLQQVIRLMSAEEKAELDNLGRLDQYFTALELARCSVYLQENYAAGSKGITGAADLTKVTENLILKTEAADSAYEAVWSSDSAAAAISGNQVSVIRPAYGASAVEANLTVTLTNRSNRSIVKTASFHLTILPETEAPIEQIERTDTATNITVSGNLPVDTELLVNSVIGGTDYALAEKVLKSLAGQFKLFELSLKQGGTEIQPQNGPVTVEIPLPESYKADQTTVYLIREDGTATAVTAAFENGKLLFTRDSLGLYAVAQQPGQSADHEQNQEDDKNTDNQPNPNQPNGKDEDGENDTPKTGEDQRLLLSLVILLFSLAAAGAALLRRKTR